MCLSTAAVTLYMVFAIDHDGTSDLKKQVLSRSEKNKERRQGLLNNTDMTGFFYLSRNHAIYA